MASRNRFFKGVIHLVSLGALKQSGEVPVPPFPRVRSGKRPSPSWFCTCRAACLSWDGSARTCSRTGTVGAGAFIGKAQVAKAGCRFIFVRNYSFVPFCLLHVLQTPAFFRNSLTLKVHLLSPALSLSEGLDILLQVRGP